MKYILAIDIGGTTFNSGLYTQDFNKIDVCDKEKIRHFNNREFVVTAILEQLKNLIKKNNIDKTNILGIGIASPGPIDVVKGKILDTINLTSFQNYNIVEDLSKRTGFNTYIENDANLFALGEWSANYKDKDVVVGVTIGTGFGVGVVVNGKLFLGAHGMAMEYSTSPFKWGACEENISIRYLRKAAERVYGESLSPRVIQEYYLNGDREAERIYNDFGDNLGIALSHVINMLDPNVVVLGGGLSKGFECYKKSMFDAIKKYSQTFTHNKIDIVPSKLREKATMLGASVLVKKQIKI